MNVVTRIMCVPLFSALLFVYLAPVSGQENTDCLRLEDTFRVAGRWIDVERVFTLGGGTILALKAKEVAYGGQGQPKFGAYTFPKGHLLLNSQEPLSGREVAPTAYGLDTTDDGSGVLIGSYGRIRMGEWKCGPGSAAGLLEISWGSQQMVTRTVRTTVTDVDNTL